MFVRPVGGFTVQCQTCHGAVLFGIGMVVALHNSAGLLPALTGALEVGTIVALLCVPEPGHGVSELRV